MVPKLLILLSMALLVASEYSKHSNIQSLKSQLGRSASDGRDLHTQETSHHGGYRKHKYPGKLKAKNSKWWDGYVKGWYDGWNQGFNWHKNDGQHGGHGGGGHAEEHQVEHGGHYGHLIGHHSHSTGSIGYGGDAYGHSAHASEQIPFAAVGHRTRGHSMHGHDLLGSGEHSGEVRRRLIHAGEGYSHGTSGHVLSNSNRGIPAHHTHKVQLAPSY